MEDFDVVGQLQKVPIAQAMAGFLGPHAANVPQWMNKPGGVQSGIHTPDEALEPLPFTEINNNGVIDPTHTELEFESFPQRPFRGERLIISAFSAAIANPEGACVITPAMFVGATQVGATQGRVPIGTFAATAFGVRITFPPAGPGIRVFVPIVSLITPGAGQSIIVTVTVLGRSIR